MRHFSPPRDLIGLRAGAQATLRGTPHCYGYSPAWTGASPRVCESTEDHCHTKPTGSAHPVSPGGRRIRSRASSAPLWHHEIDRRPRLLPVTYGSRHSSRIRADLGNGICDQRNNDPSVISSYVYDSANKRISRGYGGVAKSLVEHQTFTFRYLDSAGSRPPSAALFASSSSPSARTAAPDQSIKSIMVIGLLRDIIVGAHEKLKNMRYVFLPLSHVAAGPQRLSATMPHGIALVGLMFS